MEVIKICFNVKLGFRRSFFCRPRYLPEHKLLCSNAERDNNNKKGLRVGKTI